MRVAILVAVVAAAGCQTGAAPVDPNAAPDPTGKLTPLSAAEIKYPDLRAFWGRAVDRTCGPNSGVCHDNKQFPDMQTASGLLDAIGKRCNQIRDDPSTIDNLCEPAGDEIQIGAFKTRIGKVTPMPPAPAMPSTLTVTLHDPLPQGTKASSVTIVRQRARLAPVTFTIPVAAMMPLQAGAASVTINYLPIADAKKTPGPTAAISVGAFLAPAAFAPGDDTQVELGDPNGDGVFGADLGGAVIKPGDPMKSYLFLRVMAPLAVGGGNMNTNVMAPASIEPQMPIANQRYWDLDGAYVALWCWISTMKDAASADGKIDYPSCDLSKMPVATKQPGLATTWLSVYRDVLQPQCAGPCHYAGTHQPTTFYMEDAKGTFDLLIGNKGSGPTEGKLPFVTPNDPMKSFLYVKVSGDSTVGARMPLGGQLTPEEIDAVGNWISQGANEY